MPFEPASAEVTVLTFKEGLFAAAAHDLKLKVREARVEVDEEARQVRARLKGGALEVVCAMKDGQEAPGALGPRDREEIDQRLRHEVLQVDRYPEIVFESLAVEAGRVRGRLSLHGVSREIAFPWAEEPGARTATLHLDQRDWGIVPYRGLMGALRVKAEVVVQVRLPRGGRSGARAA